MKAEMEKNQKNSSPDLTSYTFDHAKKGGEKDEEDNAGWGGEERKPTALKWPDKDICLKNVT